jgi:hypothetical protein
LGDDQNTNRFEGSGAARIGEAGKDSLLKQLDFSEIARQITIPSAFAYVVGVVTVNTYLHDLGIVDFSFVKPKLLLTGICVSISFLLLAYPAFFAAWSLSFHEGPLWGRCPRRVWGLVWISVVLLLVVCACLCLREAPGLGQTAVWFLWKIVHPKSLGTRALMALALAFAVYLPIVVGSGAVLLAGPLLKTKEVGQRTEPVAADYLYLSCAAAVVMISIVAYGYLFATTFYPAIPQQFGGGQPYYERFSIADGDLHLLQQLGIPFDSNRSNITMPLAVVHETDNQVAVWLTNTDSNEQKKWQFVVALLDKKLISSISAHENRSASELKLPTSCESATRTPGSKR